MEEQKFDYDKDYGHVLHFLDGFDRFLPLDLKSSYHYGNNVYRNRRGKSLATHVSNKSYS
jgi:hypothetical protein